MKVIIKRKNEFRVSRWDGGTTTELYLYPENGSYQDRNFQVRLSSAVVEKEESDFTFLPGVHRFLSMQKGQVRLELGQSGSVCLHPLEIFEFEGDVPVHCYGSGTDLNLMLKNGARGTLTCVKAGPGEMISIPAGSGMFHAVYVIKGELDAGEERVFSGELILLDMDESLRLVNTEAETAAGIFSWICSPA